MTWDYDTITSATPADALADKIEAAMTDNGSYTHVETVTVASNDYRIWHNSSKGFHVILYHATAGTGNLNFQMCETYDSSANTMGYVGAPGSTAYGVITSDYGYTNTSGGSATGFTLNSSANIRRQIITTNTTGFTYLVSATSDRVVVATYIGTTAYGPLYIGTFESFLDGSGGTSAIEEPGAFCIADLSSSSCGATRFVDIVAGSYRFHATTPHLTTYGTPAALAFPWNGIVVSRIRIYPSSSGSGTTLGPRGLLKGVVAMSNYASYSFGDELNVGGTAKYKVVTTTEAVEML